MGELNILVIKIKKTGHEINSRATRWKREVLSPKIGHKKESRWPEAVSGMVYPVDTALVMVCTVYYRHPSVVLCT